MASCSPMTFYHWKYWLIYMWILCNLSFETAPASVTVIHQNADTNCKEPWTVGKELCHFPFTYLGRVYDSCTTENNNGKLWCSLTKTYDGLWDNCAHCSKDGKIQDDCRERTSGGEGGGKMCSIPFVYNGRVYHGCTGTNHHQSWCSTDPVYSKKWGNCMGCSAVAAQASFCLALNYKGQETRCSFPFEYEGWWFDTCTDYKNNKTLWCSFTTFYSRQWGNCLGDCGTVRVVGTTTPAQVGTKNPVQQTTRPFFGTTRPTFLQTFIRSTIISSLPTLPNAFDVKTTDKQIQQQKSTSGTTTVTVPPTTLKKTSTAQPTSTITTLKTTIPTPATTTASTIKTTASTPKPTSTTKSTTSATISTTKTTASTTKSTTTTKTTSTATSTTASTPSSTTTTASSTTSSTTLNTTPDQRFLPCREYTSGGSANGAQCFFPFLYKNKVFYSCTGEDFLEPNSTWCSTSPVYEGYWGRCRGCAEPEWAPCNVYTIDVIAGKEGAPCYFPFTYKDVTYFKCTEVDDTRPWCSLTPFYQGSWGACNGCIPPTLAPTTTEAPVTTSVISTEFVCGVRYFARQTQPAIVGGSEAPEFSWPWQLSLRKYGFHRCGAIIISERWALTAAHCVEKNGDHSAYEVMAGAHSQVNPNENTRQIRKVDNVIIHPDYRAIHVGPDIALVYTVAPFDFTRAGVLPACLPQREIYDNENCYITGWGGTQGTGSNNVLREAPIPQIPKSICNSQPWWFNLVNEFEICVGREAGFYGACYGDSGGPLSCLREDGNWHVAGVTSWIPTDCTTPKKASVYTSVYALRDWIFQNTGLVFF